MLSMEIHAPEHTLTNAPNHAWILIIRHNGAMVGDRSNAKGGTIVTSACTIVNGQYVDGLSSTSEKAQDLERRALRSTAVEKEEPRAPSVDAVRLTTSPTMPLPAFPI